MTDHEPRCEKCGLEMTTALMAAFCPLHRECEFWPKEADCAEFMESLRPRLAALDAMAAEAQAMGLYDLEPASPTPKENR